MKPLDIDRALADRNLLGAGLGPVASWATWLTVLRAGFGLPLITEDEAIAFKQIAVAASRQQNQYESYGLSSAEEAASPVWPQR